MCKVEVQKIERPENNNQEVRKSVQIHGLNTYILIFLACFCIQLIIENYNKYGIIKDPFDIINEFTNFINSNWTFYAILIAGYLVQLVGIFSIEKFIVLKYLSENVGLLLHGLTILLLTFASLFLFPIYNINPVLGHLTAGYIGVIFFKQLSYVLENKKARNNLERKRKGKAAIQTVGTHSNTNTFPDDGHSSQEQDKFEKLAAYPESLTFYNLLHFMHCTGNFIYKPNSLIKTQRQLKKFALAACYGVLAHFGCTFVIYQYIIPELESAKTYIDDEQNLKLISCTIRLLVPVNLVWISIVHLWCLECFLPMFGWIWGYKSDTFVLDWWNAKNMSVFWTKWNYQVHTIFKNYVFTPMLERGYGKLRAAIAVACTTAVFHEYLIAVPFRSSFGLPFIVYTSQIPFAIITALVAKTFGDKVGNILVVTSLSVSYAIAAVVLYYNYTS